MPTGDAAAAGDISAREIDASLASLTTCHRICVLPFLVPVAEYSNQDKLGICKHKAHTQCAQPCTARSQGAKNNLTTTHDVKQADVLFGSKSQQEQCRNVHFDWQLLPFLPIFLGIEDFPTGGLSQGHTAEVAQCVRLVLLSNLVLRLPLPRSCELPSPVFW